MSKQAIELSSITLTTDDGTEVKLTVQQARSLHAQFDELFGTKVQFVPSAPVIIERDRWPSPWRPHRPLWVVSDRTTTTLPLGEIMCRDDRAGLSVRYQGAVSDSVRRASTTSTQAR